MLRTFGVVTALQILALTPVWACTGQVGNVIFQDSFGDDTGGWDERPPWATVKPPNFVFAMDAQNSFTNVLNLTFNATDGDYCMELEGAWQGYSRTYQSIDNWGDSGYVGQSFGYVDTIVPRNIHFLVEYIPTPVKPQ